MNSTLTTHTANRLRSTIDTTEQDFIPLLNESSFLIGSTPKIQDILPLPHLIYAALSCKGIVMLANLFNISHFKIISFC